MAQLGYNTGPRANVDGSACEANVFGFAKSWLIKLGEKDKKEREEHDRDAIAAFALVWALAKAKMPKEVTDDINAGYEMAAPLPSSMATRDIPPGMLHQLFHN